MQSKDTLNTEAKPTPDTTAIFIPLGDVTVLTGHSPNGDRDDGSGLTAQPYIPKGQ